MAEVLVLGTAHLAGDADSGMRALDVHSPERQQQFDQFARSLERFEPTKIALEVAPDQSHHLARFYTAYLEGGADSNATEAVQIGFRLAKLVGHDRLFGVDENAPLDRSRYDDGYDPFESSHDLARAFASEVQERWSQCTVTDWYLWLNSPPILRRMHAPYLGYVAQGRGFAGADFVASWYRRNLRIYSNLCRIADPDDRIVLVYGLGHAPLLRHLTDGSAEHSLIELSTLIA